MKRNKVVLYFCCMLIMFLAILVSWYFFIYKEETSKKLHISLIAYGNQTDDFEMIENGMKHAATQYEDQYTFEFNVLLAAEEMGVEEQMSLVEREIQSGCDRMMIAPIDLDATISYLESKNWNIPVILIETGSQEVKNYRTVTADHYSMGKLLGEKIVQMENPEVKIAVIEDQMSFGKIQNRFDGVLDELEAYHRNVVFWKRNDNEMNMDSLYFLQRAMVEEAVDVVVALDDEATEAVADAAENLNKNIQIYGIASSDKAVNYLDKQMVRLLIYENEFNVGYVAMQALMSRKNIDYEKFMEYRAIEKDNMYSSENEKLIFPFVK